MEYPKKESEKIELGINVIAGLLAHPDIFVGVDPVPLQGSLGDFNISLTDQTNKIAAAQLSTQVKDQHEEGYDFVLKSTIKRAEIVTHNNPDLMKLLGVHVKPHSKSVPVPGVPRAFEAIRQGAGTVRLDWKCPATGTGGEREFYMNGTSSQQAAAPQAPGWNSRQPSIS